MYTCNAFRKLLNCKAADPQGPQFDSRRSLLKAKGHYLVGANLDNRFASPPLGLALYPFVKNVSKYGGGFWNYMYRNPEDSCKFAFLMFIL